MLAGERGVMTSETSFLASRFITAARRFVTPFVGYFISNVFLNRLLSTVLFVRKELQFKR
jgi:hypothetical protein